MISFTSCLLFLLYTLMPQPPAEAVATGTMVLEISNLPADKSGTLYIGIYDNEANYPQEGKSAHHRLHKVNKQERAIVQINNVAYGEYAIALFYDANGNGKIDTNLFGIPTEPYGFSNNVFHATRATSFQEAKFGFSKSEQVVSLQVKK